MTEGPRVNFVMREALFEIYTWILCLSYLHEIQTSRIQSLYLPLYLLYQNFPALAMKISVFKYTTGLYSEQPGRYSEQPAHTYRFSLQGKMDVRISLRFIVAENTRSVNIIG